MEAESLELGIWDLPEDCISLIFSLTSPPDACRCSAVSSNFQAAAESDAVWERFLPSNWEGIISKSVSPVEFSSLRAVYFHLCDSPILVDDQGKKSFALDKESGKIYYMIGPEDLSIRLLCRYVCFDTFGIFPMTYSYEFETASKTRFSEVYDVNDVSSSLLQIHGRIQMQFLSPNTTYAAYLVYAPPPRPVAFKVSGRFVANGVENKVEQVSDNADLLPADKFTPKQGVYSARDTSNKWMKVEIGEFFSGGQDNVEVEFEMRLWEIREFTFVCPSGLDHLQGIQIRPKKKGPVSHRIPL